MNRNYASIAENRWCSERTAVAIKRMGARRAHATEPSNPIPVYR